MATPPPSSKVGLGVCELTPHKIAICHLIQVFAPPAQSAVPIPFTSVSQHNRLGLFLFSVTRTCDDFIEPPLCELINQLKGISGLGTSWCGNWLSQSLMDRLQNFSSPDDLFTFFDKLRAVLLSLSGVNYHYDQIFLDPNSHLGVFLRGCILAFNVMTFEATCHLLTNIGTYCNSADSSYESQEDEYNESELRDFLENEEIDLKGGVSDKYSHGFDVETSTGGSSSFHIRARKSLYGLVDDIQVPVDSMFMKTKERHQGTGYMSPQNYDFRVDDHQRGLSLQSKWQVLGYLNGHADLLEKHSSTLPLNSLDEVLKQVHKMAPEMHRVRYLQYLNSLYHEDYLPAMDSLHCYFDYSAGMDGIFTGSPKSYTSDIQMGRYESALLCLGTLHCHFGHSKLALEALTEAVRISQLNNDDSCLAYTLATICNLLSEIGISSSTGIIGSPYTLLTDTGMGVPPSIQQQLLVLLMKSQKWAEDLKLTCLVGFNRLALAKFELKNLKRSLLSFGPKAPTKLRTSPVSVCKDLRLSSYLFSEFRSDGLSLPNDSSAFSTSWIKNLSKHRDSFSSSNVHWMNDYDTYNFGAQPNPIPGSVLQLAGASYLLRATSWELYGSYPLARANTLIHLTCFADAASSADLSLAYVKLIQHLAVFKGYKVAIDALKLVEEKFIPVSKSRVHFLKLQLLHEHALHRGRLKFAQEVCDEFSVLASSVNGVDIELKIEASIRHSRTLLAANQFSQASDVAHSLFRTCYKYSLHVENASVLLLLAEIHKKSGNAVLGLPYALASLSFCRSFNLDLLEASATLTVAELWLSLGSSHAKRASSLVNRTLPIIFGHGGLELRARANVIDVKCRLSDPNFSVSEDSDFVLDSLKQAAEDLEILEYHERAAETFYLTSMVHNMLGQVEEREEAASSFKRHINALENVGVDDDLGTHWL